MIWPYFPKDGERAFGVNLLEDARGRHRFQQDEQLGSVFGLEQAQSLGGALWSHRSDEARSVVLVHVEEDLYAVEAHVVECRTCAFRGQRCQDGVCMLAVLMHQDAGDMFR